MITKRFFSKEYSSILDQRYAQSKQNFRYSAVTEKIKNRINGRTSRDLLDLE